MRSLPANANDISLGAAHFVTLAHEGIDANAGFQPANQSPRHGDSSDQLRCVTAVTQMKAEDMSGIPAHS
jgi:hypothetical protein